MLPVRQSYLLAAVIITISIAWLSCSWNEPIRIRLPLGYSSSWGDLAETKDNDEFLEALQQRGIREIVKGSTVEYAKVELDAEVQSDFETPMLQKLDIRLPEGTEVETLGDIGGHHSERARTTVSIEKPHSIPDASNIIFGAATTLERTEQSLNAFSHWASGTRTRILILIEEGPTQIEIDRVIDRATSMGIRIQIVPVALKHNDRYFLLLRALHENIDRNTEWAAIIDDDTFFPSMTNLLGLLARHDHTKPQYVGGLSEDFVQVNIFGLIGFGGAGVFLSVPLLDEVAPHYEECATSDHTGDRRIADCILTYSQARMTNEPSLHQMDIRDDVSGFYEALRPQPVSIHHWKSWYWYPMDEIAPVSKVCGEKCLFQTYRFMDDWQLTNGISIVKYSGGRGADDFVMEQTWRNSIGDNQVEMFRHSLAPTRPPDAGKISYIMEHAQYDETKNEARQLYIRRQPKQKKLGIIEVIWRRRTKRH